MCFHQTVVSLFPVSGIDKIIPFRAEVVQRTAGCHTVYHFSVLAERHSACHTACSLKLLFFQRQRDMKFVKIFDTFKRCDLFTHSSFVL